MSLVCREDLLKDLEESVVFSGRSGTISAEMRGANKVIDRIKSAPVVSGQWVDVFWNESWQAMTATCSHCHVRGEVRVKKNERHETVIDSPFCPNCGADMRGEES